MRTRALGRGGLGRGGAWRRVARRRMMGRRRLRSRRGEEEVWAREAQSEAMAASVRSHRAPFPHERVVPHHRRVHSGRSRKPTRRRREGAGNRSGPRHSDGAPTRLVTGGSAQLRGPETAAAASARAPWMEPRPDSSPAVARGREPEAVAARALHRG